MSPDQWERRVSEDPRDHLEREVFKVNLVIVVQLDHPVLLVQLDRC